MNLQRYDFFLTYQSLFLKKERLFYLDYCMENTCFPLMRKACLYSYYELLNLKLSDNGHHCRAFDSFVGHDAWRGLRLLYEGG